MRTMLVLALLTVALAAQQNPAQPFPNHEQPPSGWFCHPARNAEQVQTDAHACECRGMLNQNPDPFCWAQGEDDNGEPMDVPLGESSKCKSYCHRDHCTCSTRCDES